MRHYTFAPMDQPSVHFADGAFIRVGKGWLPSLTPDALATTLRRRRAQQGATLRGPSARRTARDLQAEAVVGPWLVGLDPWARTCEHWVPAPADAWLRLKPEAPCRAVRVRLVPRDADADVQMDLLSDLSPLTLADGAPQGAPADPVAHWRWSEMQRWLATPEAVDEVSLARLGLPPIAAEGHAPLHLAPLSPEVRVTTGPLPTVAPPPPERYLERSRECTLRLGLGFSTDLALEPLWLAAGDAALPMALDEEDDRFEGLPLPALEITGSRVRVILLTPGAFAPIARPCPQRLHDLGVRLVAAAVGPLQWTEAWGTEAWATEAGEGSEGLSQPGRRLAPAGSVYWLEVLSGDAAAWARTHQFASLCDQEQDRLDGLGCFVVGVA